MMVGNKDNQGQNAVSAAFESDTSRYIEQRKHQFYLKVDGMTTSPDHLDMRDVQCIVCDEGKPKRINKSNYKKQDLKKLNFRRDLIADSESEIESENNFSISISDSGFIEPFDNPSSSFLVEYNNQQLFTLNQQARQDPQASESFNLEALLIK